MKTQHHRGGSARSAHMDDTLNVLRTDPGGLGTPGKRTSAWFYIRTSTCLHPTFSDLLELYPTFPNLPRSSPTFSDLLQPSRTFSNLL